MPLRGVSLCLARIMPYYHAVVGPRSERHAYGNCHTPAPHCGMLAASPDDAPTDALRAAGWQPVELLPCGCTPERLCAPHGWLRDAEEWERYVNTPDQGRLTLDL